MSWIPGCLVCIVEEKQDPNRAPQQFRDAVTFAATELGPMTPICYQHLQVQQRSSLLVPTGPGAVQLPG